MNLSLVSTALLPLLPARLRNLTRLIGLAMTMTIVQHYGGSRLYIPSRATADHPLAALLGFEVLETFSKVYGLEDHFDVPKAAAALRFLRDEKIRRDQGIKSTRVLAFEHRLTERQVWKILANKKAALPAGSSRSNAGHASPWSVLLA